MPIVVMSNTHNEPIKKAIDHLQSLSVEQSAQRLRLPAAEIESEYQPTSNVANEEAQHTYAKGSLVHLLLGGSLDMRGRLTNQSLFLLIEICVNLIEKPRCQQLI